MDGNWDLETVGNKIANLTMWDVKSAYRAARDYALNVSPIESKVRDATSNDPWGASSTLMAEIAADTNDFTSFQEIMTVLFSRFMEKEASEWRQIYKALVLLEYLVKNGSERVVDEARANISTVKILRSFHYIDEKAKDQGINVRNRAKELAELLADVERIRTERRKARSNKNKYQGHGTDFGGQGTGRYGGFSSDAYHSGQAAGAGSGSGNGGGDYDRRQSSFDEYDAGDDDAGEAPRRSTSAHQSSSTSTSARRSAAAGGTGTSSRTASKPAPAAAAPVKQVDLFSFDDDEPLSAPALSAPVSAGKGKAAAASVASPDAFGDDFDDFQGAPAAAPAPSAPAASQPSFASSNFNSSSVLQPASLRPNPPAAQAASSSTTSSAAKPAGIGGFDDLWSSAAPKSSSGSGAMGGGAAPKKTMADLAKDKSAAGLFASPSGGGGAGSNGNGNKGMAAPSMGGKKPDLFDLL
ncbi:hypothetical protein CF319_g4118 [Tilletia indica]|nr:hypothetical protein CF319_g4118 [Tilletia indica]